MFAVQRKWRFGLLAGLTCAALGAIIVPGDKFSSIVRSHSSNPALSPAKMRQALDTFDASRRRQDGLYLDAKRNAIKTSQGSKQRFDDEANRIADELTSLSFLGWLGWAKARENIPTAVGGKAGATEELVRSIVTRRYAVYRLDNGKMLSGEFARLGLGGASARSTFAKEFAKVDVDLSQHLIERLPSASKLLKSVGVDLATRLAKQWPITRIAVRLSIGQIVSFALDIYDFYDAASSVRTDLRQLAFDMTREFYAKQIDSDLSSALRALDHAHDDIDRTRCSDLNATYAANPVPTFEKKVAERCPPT